MKFLTIVYFLNSSPIAYILLIIVTIMATLTHKILFMNIAITFVFA